MLHLHIDIEKKNPFRENEKGLVWAHLGSNQGLSDYESDTLTS